MLTVKGEKHLKIAFAPGGYNEMIGFALFECTGETEIIVVIIIIVILLIVSVNTYIFGIGQVYIRVNNTLTE